MQSEQDITFKHKLTASILFSCAMGLLLVCYTMQSCQSKSDFNKGKKQLESIGYTAIENTGHSWFCCNEDDIYATGFKAINKIGEKVEGCFCSSLSKGITIRFE